MIPPLQTFLALPLYHSISEISNGIHSVPLRLTSSTSLFSTPPTKQSKMDASERRIEHYLDPELLKRKPKASKQTSSFWYSDVERPLQTEDEVLPFQQNMDTEGRLPFGSYKTLGKQEFGSKPVSLLSIGMNFWNHPVSSKNNPDVDIDIAVMNAQKLIDSGFTTFSANIPKRVIGPTCNMKSSQNKWIERNIFANLVDDTPTSVLDQVHLGTRIRVPSINDDVSFSPSKVRQIIGESIIDIYGETTGCLDSVELDVGARSTNDFSPYTLDVLDVLFEMQREGFIRSIGGHEISKTSLHKIESSGFEVDFNRISCNILDPTNYADQSEEKTKLILNSPLAGGILTNKFYDLDNGYRDRKGIPRLDILTASELNQLNYSIDQVWRSNYQKKKGVKISKPDAWRLVESNVIGTMYQIALKHNVDIASVAFRWAMQMDKVGSVSVGSSLNALDDNNFPFSRPRGLRKAFTFYLDEEDMGMIQEIAGGSLLHDKDHDPESLLIDMNNKKLWL
jgi:diketogulonate reductase-like aldo/keto reductase